MSFLSMSTISALRQNINLLKQAPELHFREASNLNASINTNYRYFDYLNAESWINLPFTEGIDVLSPEGLRILIESYLLSELPTYLNLFPSGRRLVQSALTVNENQVFRNAELFNENPSIEVVEWWDRLASRARMLASNSFYRKYESRSYELELENLSETSCPHQPVWIALDDNNLGYDILSYRFDGISWKPHAIEVKSSVGKHIRFHLSRNEAKTALSFKNNYELHFWFESSRVPIIISSEKLFESFPINQNHGEWEDAIFTFPS